MLSKPRREHHRLHALACAYSYQPGKGRFRLCCAPDVFSHVLRCKDRIPTDYSGNETLKELYQEFYHLDTAYEHKRLDLHDGQNNCSEYREVVQIVSRF